MRYLISSLETQQDERELDTFQECIDWVRSYKNELEDQSKFVAILKEFDDGDEYLEYPILWKDGKSNIDEIIVKMKKLKEIKGWN